MSILDPRLWLALILSHTLAFYAGGWDKADKVKAAITAKTIEVKDKQQTVLAKADSNQVATQEAIRTIYQDRIIYREKKVPYEVTVRQDSHCTIPHYFVSLWNSGNRAEPADLSSLLDEAPSAVKLSDVGSQHEREAELCNSTTAQLNGLIDAIEAVGRIK